MSTPKLTIKSLKPSKNGKSVMANFELSYTKHTVLDSNLTPFQRAQGMKAAEYSDAVLRYATERLTPEAAANLTEGQEISGFTIQTFQSPTPIYVVDGVAQGAAKNGAYFDGELVELPLGGDVPADKFITMDSAPERYRVVNGDKTVRGIAAVQLMKDARAAAAAVNTPLDGASVNTPAPAAADATV
jgi:hypothetical protein